MGEFKMSLGKIFLVPTPIGNLKDITLRALETLENADEVAAEDTRQTLKLLNHFNIKKPLFSYHQHNEQGKSEDIIDKLKAGKNIALVTDAGTPGISDPGEELVRQCIDAGIEVSSVPGPAACITALTMSGQATRRFAFEAFLPSDKKERAPIEKLRIELKPTNSIEFIDPKITTSAVLKRDFELIDFIHTDDKQCVSGNISVQAIVDLSQNAPLYVRLNITYDNIRSGDKLATVVYSAQISPKVLHQQLNLYEDDSLSLNQDLFVCILEKMLNNMYADIFVQYADFPYTRDMLYINNVRELLNDMQLIFMKEGQFFGEVQGGKIWHTGY